MRPGLKAWRTLRLAFYLLIVFGAYLAAAGVFGFVTAVPFEDWLHGVRWRPDDVGRAEGVLRVMAGTVLAAFGVGLFLALGRARGDERNDARQE